ncbi:L,D-transpeptidase [Clostridium prolinivorans]|jgi:lipoprotein-anchoring transpeptidase ErfK/SrfK|uniref:L,D-transpeptidase n=1 Tax=Clostridium prolinivorans TaxID=2769420 RepID=UPI000FDA3495|nr:L,D-transpeptidase [Clostridium prolinivorans]
MYKKIKILFLIAAAMLLTNCDTKSINNIATANLNTEIKQSSDANKLNDKSLAKEQQEEKENPKIEEDNIKKELEDEQESETKLKQNLKTEEQKQTEKVVKKNNATTIKKSDVSKNTPEQIVNNKNLSSSTKYLIYVDLKSRPQTTYIFQGSKNKWKLTKSFICSGGLSKHPTVTGQYTVKSKGKWFFNEKYKEGAETYTQFYGNYLFHTVPMDKNHKVTNPNLGQPSSHGCIRLGIPDARWIYYNIPKGTKVYIPYAY